MKPIHTPGPWAVNPSNAQVDAFDNGEPLPVCQMLWPTDKRGEDETLANAQLIAKAPEMAAEVERLRAEVADLRASNARLEAEYNSALDEGQESAERAEKLLSALLDAASILSDAATDEEYEK